MVPNISVIANDPAEPQRGLSGLCADCWKSGAPAACPSAYRWCPDMGQATPTNPIP